MQQAQKGSMIDIAVFYFAHRPLLEATIAAHQRGASIRVLLDANNEAFGFSKNGIPNRQIAIDLHRAGIPIRWCATSGEQCHSKFLLSRNPDGTAEMVLGSANFTRSNLDNFNLETSVRLMAPSHQTVIKEATAFFQRQWHNQGGQFSLPYEANEDTSLRRYWLYRFTEASGLSTF
nr:phospholipase D-like domain-containing protein [Desulfurispira natronophila]